MAEPLSKDKEVANETVSTIVKLSHPLFHKLQNALKISFPLFITSLDELDAVLEFVEFRRHRTPETQSAPAFGFRQMTSSYDVGLRDATSFYRWKGDDESHRRGDTLYVAKRLFDTDGKLVNISQRDWNDDYVAYTETESEAPSGLNGTYDFPDTDDAPPPSGNGEDIPF